MDTRNWATLGMFLLVFYVVTLIAFLPAVSESELFKTVATLILGSGAFGLVCAFLWGGSKATTGAIDTVNEMARANAPPPGTAQVVAAPDVDITVREAADAVRPPWERDQ
jgi:hypothetical protein